MQLKADRAVGIDNQSKALRGRSGSVDSSQKLVGFLYELMRDHLPAGTVEQLVRQNQSDGFQFSNGHLARYAVDLAMRLVPSLDDPEGPVTSLSLTFLGFMQQLGRDDTEVLTKGDIRITHDAKSLNPGAWDVYKHNKYIATINSKQQLKAVLDDIGTA